MGDSTARRVPLPDWDYDLSDPEAALRSLECVIREREEDPESQRYLHNRAGSALIALIDAQLAAGRARGYDFLRRFEDAKAREQKGHR